MELPPWWLELVDVRRRAKGWTRTELARQADLEGAWDITRLMDNKASSRIVAKVAKALEIIDPIAAVLAPDNQEWVQIGLTLRQYEPERFAEVFSALKSSAEAYRATTRGLDQAMKAAKKAK